MILLNILLKEINNKNYMRLKRIIYNTLNYSALYFSFTPLISRKKIKALKNKYAGKRCFIVCNGPSLRADDLTKIYDAGDVSIGMNFIANIYSQTPWRPEILVCTDGCVFSEKGKSLVRYCEAGVKVFQFKDYLKSLSYKGNKICMNLYGSEELLDNPRFSEELDKIIWAIGTTSYECIEWARWMGCNEIYILGCDMSYAVNANRDGSIYYNNNGANHFYAQSKDVVSAVKPVQTWQQKLAFRAADDYSRAHGFRIYNATRGGFLEELERIDFDSLFK